MGPRTALHIAPGHLLAILLIGAVSITPATAQESFYLYERNALAGNYTAKRNAAYCLKIAKCEGVIFKDGRGLRLADRDPGIRPPLGKRVGHREL